MSLERFSRPWKSRCSRSSSTGYPGTEARFWSRKSRSSEDAGFARPRWMSNRPRPIDWHCASLQKYRRFWLDVPAVVQFDDICLEPGKRSKRPVHFITEYIALVNLEEMQNLIVAMRSVWKNSKRGKLNTRQRST